MPYLATPSFGIRLSRDPYDFRPRRRWSRWSFRIGLGQLGRPNSWYRWNFGLALQLLPDFVWWQDYLGQERGHDVFQYRICGVMRGWRPIQFVRRAH